MRSLKHCIFQLDEISEIGFENKPNWIEYFLGSRPWNFFLTNFRWKNSDSSELLVRGLPSLKKLIFDKSVWRFIFFWFLLWFAQKTSWKAEFRLWKIKFCHNFENIVLLQAKSSIKAPDLEKTFSKKFRKRRCRSLEILIAGLLIWSWEPMPFFRQTFSRFLLNFCGNLPRKVKFSSFSKRNLSTSFFYKKL